MSTYRNKKIAILVLTSLFILHAPVSATTVFFDNFNDDSGDLSGETAPSGHVWLSSSKGETAGRSLTTGPSFGQGGTVGAGDAESGVSKLWKGNMVLLGQELGNTPGTWVISADLIKNHAAGINHEMNLVLRSSSQNSETIIRYINDKLQTDGDWFDGASTTTAFGTPASIHIDLMLYLVSGGGPNAAALDWFEIGNPTNNGSVNLGSENGSLLYDEIHLLTFTQNSLTVGFDNISITPEPATCLLLGLGGLLALLKKRRA